MKHRYIKINIKQSQRNKKSMRLSTTDGSGDPVCTLKQKENWEIYQTISKRSKNKRIDRKS